MFSHSTPPLLCQAFQLFLRCTCTQDRTSPDSRRQKGLFAQHGVTLAAHTWPQVGKQHFSSVLPGNCFASGLGALGLVIQFTTMPPLCRALNAAKNPQRAAFVQLTYVLTAFLGGDTSGQAGHIPRLGEYGRTVCWLAARQGLLSQDCRLFDWHCT